MKSTRQQSASLEDYISDQIYADVDGLPIDPTGLPVSLAFVPQDADRTAQVTWAELIALPDAESGTAAWETDSTVTPNRYFIRILASGVGVGGVVELPKDTYDVFAQFIDSPEEPVKRVGRHTVT